MTSGSCTSASAPALADRHGSAARRVDSPLDDTRGGRVDHVDTKFVTCQNGVFPIIPHIVVLFLFVFNLIN